jgi:glycosyltransferase involved in cell wall biosynthesis
MRISVLGTRGVPANYSGLETAVERIGERLAGRGHEIAVYCRKHNVTIEDDVYKGMQLVKLPSINNKYLDTLSHTFLSLLHAFVRRPDLIHLYGVGNSVFLIPLRLLGRPIVISVDALDWQRKKWNRFAALCLRSSAGLAVRFSDEYVVDSQEVAKYYIERYDKRPVYIAYGADMPEHTYSGGTVEEFGLEPRKYVLFVGRLVPEKGVHHLIKAFEITDTDLQLAIVGDNPHNRAYVGSLKATRDPRIHFLGFVYGDGYRRLCSNAYLYVQPSDVEGTSPALLAAMGFGNCVLVSDIPENLETIGDAGFSFERGNHVSLKEKLETLIGQPQLVTEYGQRAKARVETGYNWVKIAEDMEKLYLSALHSGGRPRDGGANEG